MWRVGHLTTPEIRIAINSSAQHKELIGCAIDRKLIVAHKLSEILGHL